MRFIPTVGAFRDVDPRDPFGVERYRFAVVLADDSIVDSVDDYPTEADALAAGYAWRDRAYPA